MTQLSIDFIPSSLYEVSEVKVSYTPMFSQAERPQIMTSNDAVNMFRKAWDSDRLEYQEDFHIMYLSRNNRVLAMYHSSMGGTTGTVVDVKPALVTALKINAHSMILAHNHPSGTLSPSSEDVAVTKQFKEAAKLLSMDVLDHVILTRDSYYSFADQGMM
jgi:DNA repair protein RadC